MSKQGHENSYPAGVLADNVHDRRLIEQVRPPGWVNPQPQGRYHLCVIGGGTAGLVAAAGAAGLGARVALIERNLLVAVQIDGREQQVHLLPRQAEVCRLKSKNKK